MRFSITTTHRRSAVTDFRSLSPAASEGIALIIVMISIFVLSVLAGGFAYSMKVETRLARNANSEIELEWLGRSALDCARWEMAQYMTIPQMPYESLDQPWAGGTSIVGISNSPLMDFKHEIQTRNGVATWTIVDLERKANINTANEASLQQALMVMGIDAGEQTPIVNSILDWIDRDDNTRVQGAESDVYQALNPPYYAKNGPIDDLSELLLVKGINPELAAGLTNLFTPMSSGKINLNTASAEVLQLIPMVTPEAAQGIVGARSGESDGSGLLGPYRNVGEVRRVPEVSLPMAGAIQQFADVRSRTFEVHIIATVNGYSRDFVGIIGRNTPRDIQVLSFYWTN